VAIYLAAVWHENQFRMHTFIHSLILHRHNLNLLFCDQRCRICCFKISNHSVYMQGRVYVCVSSVSEKSLPAAADCWSSVQFDVAHCA
jgi:hypothetical protein